MADTSFQWLTQGAAEMPKLNFPLIEQWIGEVAESRDRMLGPITYIFCDDERILEVNKQFLNHDYYTDIITFDDCRGKLLRGDIFVSLDTVETNAALQGATYDEELLRVIIHGILHLCGVNDKGPGEREIMEAAENQSLDMFKALAVKKKQHPFAAEKDSRPSEERFMTHSEKEASHLVWDTAKTADKEVWRTAKEADDKLKDTEKHF